MSLPDAHTRRVPGSVGPAPSIALASTQPTERVSRSRRTSIDWGDVLDCATSKCIGCAWAPFECQLLDAVQP